MSYLALYRRFRPTTFDKVIGQEHIIKTLKNQIMSDVYCPRTALRNGTMFPELNMPYCPNQSLDVINYLKTANEIKEGCNL